MKQVWSKSLVFSIFFLISNFVFSQDTIRYTGPAIKTGNEFALDTIRDAHIDNVLDLLLIFPYVHFGDLTSQGFITEGKKISIIQLSNLSSSLAEKNARAIFSKQPGIFIYDMDAAGNQLNVSTRGLDPHRGWEFNIRHDGILTNSDIYGYPASHYSQPFESVARIEFVRGTASVQYGAQYGGMLNMVTKKADESRVIGGENISTIGSFNLLSNYTSLGGRYKKFTYFGYISRRSRDGYRDEESSKNQGELVRLSYDPNSKLHFDFEWTRSSYMMKLAGPLNDSMFLADPTQATRSRNFYSPTISIPSIKMKWSPSEQTTVYFNASWLYGDRSSVLFDGSSIDQDTISRVTGAFAARRVDIDDFDSKTAEFKVHQRYHTLGKNHSVVVGVQVIDNLLRRRQMGTGTVNSNFDLSINEGTAFKRDMNYNSQNLAAFIENEFQLLKKLKITTGARFESGSSKITGTSLLVRDVNIGDELEHNFINLSAGFLYKPVDFFEVYGGFAQCYRPATFKDLQSGASYETVDLNIKDSYGYNSEIGVRGGNWKWSFDVSAFSLFYENRIGSIVNYDSLGGYHTLKTNIGNSISQGLELYVERKFSFGKMQAITLHTATSYTNARYLDASITYGPYDKDISGNQVESVPHFISRNGLNFSSGKLDASITYSYTAESYSDALNTEKPDASGAIGIVPAYSILDFAGHYKFSKNLTFGMAINNFMDEQYYTKRPQMYPGPGIWPSDGRSITFTIKLNY